MNEIPLSMKITDDKNPNARKSIIIFFIETQLTHTCKPVNMNQRAVRLHHIKLMLMQQQQQEKHTHRETARLQNVALTDDPLCHTAAV